MIGELDASRTEPMHPANFFLILGTSSAFDFSYQSRLLGAGWDARFPTGIYLGLCNSDVKIGEQQARRRAAQDGNFVSLVKQYRTMPVVC